MGSLFSFFASLPSLVQTLIPVFAAIFPNAQGGLAKASTVTSALTPVITGIVTAVAQQAGASAEHTEAAVAAATAHVADAVDAHPATQSDNAAQQSAAASA